MQFTEIERKSNLDGYFVYDCAVREKNSFSFLMLEQIDDAANGKRRFINYFPEDPEGDRIGKMDLTGFVRPNIAASIYPKNQAVVVASDCTVCVQGGGDGGMEQPIPGGSDPANEVLRACFNLATIDGSIYAVGPWRTICKRIGPNHWESLAGDRSTLPKPPRRGASNDGGFDAIAGFHANDLYCVGGKGDAWRYDGRRWYQCAVPTNMFLHSVCCAGDGYVYIGMQSGSVMRGREDTWEIIHRDEMTLAFKDIVWYDGKVWCTSDYGLWVIENGKLKEADVPPEVKSCSGNLSVGDGVMLLAGMYGATVYDGQEWQRII